MWNMAGTGACDMLTIRIILSDMQGELYIYWVQRNNSSVHSDAVTQSCYTLVLTNIIFIIRNFISLLLLILRTSRLNLFLGYHYATFPIRSLGFLEIFFQPSLEHFWPPFTRSSLPPGHHENHLIWVDSSFMAPPWASLVLSALAASQDIQPPVWLSQ